MHHAHLQNSKMILHQLFALLLLTDSATPCYHIRQLNPYLFAHGLLPHVEMSTCQKAVLYLICKCVSAPCCCHLLWIPEPFLPSGLCCLPCTMMVQLSLHPSLSLPGFHTGEVRTRTRSAPAPSIRQRTKCLGAGHPQVNSTTTGAKQ